MNTKISWVMGSGFHKTSPVQIYLFLCEQKKDLLKKQAANFSDIEEKLFKRFGGSMCSYSGTK